MNQPRVLVVDDDASIAASLRRALLYEGYAVTVASDGHAALLRAQSDRPDLVILDVMLPGIDGIEVCRRIRAEDDVPVLMLTARDATADRVTGLDSGADDYLVKPFAYEELLARVRALLRRKPATSMHKLGFADLVMDVGTREVKRGERFIDLTPREFDLLQFFLRNPRQVLTRDRILDIVWGYGFGAASNSVDVYVGYLRAKIEEAGRPRLLHTVRGVGYALRAA
ncbi:MAG TPA: response regulator transcription factor [Candidatus Dormibacteraeota bacterium]